MLYIFHLTIFMFLIIVVVVDDDVAVVVAFFLCFCNILHSELCLCETNYVCY
jgi:hypothetical protein